MHPNWDCEDAERCLFLWDEQVHALTGQDVSGPNVKLVSRLNAIAARVRQLEQYKNPTQGSANGSQADNAVMQEGTDALNSHRLSDDDIGATLAAAGDGPVRARASQGDNWCCDDHGHQHVQKKGKMGLQPPLPCEPSPVLIPDDAFDEIKRALLSDVTTSASVCPDHVLRHFLLTCTM